MTLHSTTLSSRTPLAIALLVALLLAPAAALAQSDRVAFGSGVHVPAGHVVHDAVAFGGDTIVEGSVEGDAVSFGGSVIVHRGADVRGDITSFGGSVVDHRTGSIRSSHSSHAAESSHTDYGAGAHTQEERGPIEGLVHWVKQTARSAMAHVLLFLLGLLMIGVTRERLGALQVTMIRDGLQTAGWGFMGFLVSLVAIVLLTLTVIGIPVAILLGLALPLATYVGLAAAATVIGAALPIPQLKGKEIPQLAAGVVVLFVASIVPFLGTIATAVAACLGLGALLRTRFAATPPRDLPEDGGGFATPAPTAA